MFFPRHVKQPVDISLSGFGHMWLKNSGACGKFKHHKQLRSNMSKIPFYFSILLFIGLDVNGLAATNITDSRAVEKPLIRRAIWQAKFKPFDVNRPGKTIKSIVESSPLAKAGLMPNDRILSVNGRHIHTATAWNDITDALTAVVPHHIAFKREDRLFNTEVFFPPIDREVHHGLDALYESVTSDYGITQRVIVTKPQGQQQPSPAVVVLQGLSCSSIEKIPNRNSAFVRLLTDIVEQSHKVVMRIEKPGMGDSEGNCSETDFKTELNGYESALKWLLAQDYVDPKRVVVYGNSMGSALAPYLTNKYDLAGVISDGTFVRSWFEHMLEIERRILQFKGLSQSEISQQMNQFYLPLYYGMLIKKQSYQEVIDDYPALTKANYHGPEHMYGRPMAYYHQLQDFDVAGEWQKLKVPARIRWGMNDWIMSEADNDMIIEILENAGHANHKLLKQAGLDHWQALHENPVDSFNGKKGQWNQDISQVIIEWLDELVK